MRKKEGLEGHGEVFSSCTDIGVLILRNIKSEDLI